METIEALRGMTEGAQGMGTIVGLFRQGEQWLVAFLLCLPRAYAFITASQLLQPTSVPRLARNVAILVIAMPLAPVTLGNTEILTDDPLRTFGYFAKEFAIGFLMGFCITWIFWAVQAAGAFIDNQRGAAIASSIDPLQGHESSPLGILFSQAFITYFFAVGGFLVITGILYSSYALWPITRFLPIFAPEFPVMMLGLLDLGMRLTVIYAAPIIAVMFFAEFGLAVVSRFSPQVQVFILAMPIKSGVAVVLLIFYLPIMMRFAVGEANGLQGVIDRFFAILEAGSGLR
ncbi:MAG: type III secretion system export apparatus subunit SctT [Paracoccaceae bacterium]